MSYIYLPTIYIPQIYLQAPHMPRGHAEVVVEKQLQARFPNQEVFDWEVISVPHQILTIVAVASM